MSEQPPNQWGQNPYEQPQEGHPTQPLGDQTQWGQQPGPYGQPQQGQQWGQQPGPYGQPQQGQQWAQQPGPYGQPQQQWGQGPGGPGGPGGPFGPGGPDQPGGSKKTLWIVLAAVVLLVAGGVVAAVLVFTGGDDDKDSADEGTSSSTSESPSESESPVQSPSTPTGPETSASTVTTPPASGDVLFVFPSEVDGRTLDPTSSPDGGVVSADDTIARATYKGSDLTDLLIYQYMANMDSEAYTDALGDTGTRVGDANCVPVPGMDGYSACAVDYADGVLVTTSNTSTVNSREEVAAALQALVAAIG